MRFNVAAMLNFAQKEKSAIVNTFNCVNGGIIDRAQHRALLSNYFFLSLNSALYDQVIKI